MRRIGFAVAVSLLVPLVGEAQQAGKVYRIGNLAPQCSPWIFLELRSWLAINPVDVPSPPNKRADVGDLFLRCV